MTPTGGAHPDGGGPSGTGGGQEDLDLRIGIVSYRTPDLLDRCLAAIPAAVGSLRADVVVWDNAPGDGSAEVARRHGAMVRGVGRNVGYSAGMNGALEGAHAEVVVALNPDTVPPPGSIRHLVDVLARRLDVAVVVPRLVTPDGRTQHSAHRFPWLPSLAVTLLVPRRWLPRRVQRQLWFPGTLTEGRNETVDWAYGAVHVMRRNVVGARPYRERWFMYVEDLDLCWRMHQAGHRTWFAGSVEVVHEGSASARQVFGVDPSQRWWGETYDWYRLIRGSARCRLYALVNAAGAIRLWRRARRRGDVAGGLRWEATIRRHLRVARTGPPPPAGPPTDISA